MEEWECMLSDVFDSVLQYLSNEDVKHSRLVCTTWRDEVDNLLSSMTLKSSAHVPHMVSRFQGLREVTLSFASEPEFSAGLLRPLRGLKRLQSVALENRGAVQPTVLGLGALSAISQLRMKGCLVSTACGLNQLTQLTEVALQHCILMLGAKSLPAMLGDMRGLRRLVCEGCSSLSEAPLAGLSMLTSLHACHLNRMTCVSDATCQELALLPKVQELQLACANKAGCAERKCITPAGIATLCAMTQLTHLDLSGHETISNASIQLIAQHLPRLVHLDIRAHAHSLHARNGQSCTEKGIGALHSLQHLQSLSISNAQVQRSACAAIASLPALRRLEISQCQSLTDTAACELARLTALQELCLSNSSRVTDIALSTLVKAMPQLLLLDLSGCHMHVSDISLYAIADLSKLTTLILKDCERITDLGIKALCKGAAAGSLQHLNMNGCDRLTDVGALRMAASLQQLRTLSLEHCQHFTSRGISALQALAALQTLRAGGMAQSAIAAAHSLRPKVTVNTFEHKRIWWMPAVPVRAVAA